ncbi:SRPBCC family protein [Nocardia panacis]|nr:SRPBCC family protein [Nocardia panacis]
MGHVEVGATARAAIEAAFEYVDDYRHVPDWMFGVKHFTPLGAQTSGVGARFDTALNLGPTTLHLQGEVVEWARDAVVTLRVRKGIEGTLRFTFQPLDAEATRIDAVVDYKVPGGLAGLALDRVLRAFIGPAVRHTERNLRERIEFDYAARKDCGS